MSCTNCPQSTGPVSTFEVQYFYNNQPTNCQDSICGSNSLNSKCVYYAGPNLSCSGIQNNESLEVALQKLDERLCATTGDYSTYNFHCLDDEGVITSEGAFVSAISAAHCALKGTVNTFIGTTYPAYQATVNTRFTAIEQPQLVHAGSGVVGADSLVTLLTKYGTKFNSIDQALSLAGVSWNSCFSVPTPPASIAGAFQLVVDRLCQAGGTAALPQFNNVGSCLPSPGAADSLVSTVEKLKARVCQSPTLNNALLTSSCVAIPPAATDLQNLVQNLLSKVDALSAASVAFDEGVFQVSLVDSQRPCMGRMIKLPGGGGASQDRFVAASAQDTTPGTLVDKIEAGVGIAIDITNPAKLVLSASGTVDDKKVKTTDADPTPGFLGDKVEAGPGESGVRATVGTTAGHKVRVDVDVNTDALFNALLDELEVNAELKARFCAIMASCPSPCDAPTNVQAVAIQSGEQPV